MVNLLKITGSASLTIVSAEGGQEITYDVSVENLTSEVVRIDTAYILVASEGGWSWMGDRGGELISRYGHFFGLDNDISPSSNQTAGPFILGTWYEPISYIIIAAHATTDTEEQDLLSVIKVTRAGFSQPQDIVANMKGPVFISLMEPVQVILTPVQPGSPDYNVKADEKRLIVMGQLVNLSGRLQRVKSLHIKVADQNDKTVIDDDYEIDKFVRDDNYFLDFTKFGHSDVFARFSNNRIVPDTFSEGKVRVSGQVEVKGFDKWRSFELSHQAEVHPFIPEVLMPPILGFYRWGNGPPTSGPYSVEWIKYLWHTHSRPEARYSYDLVAVRRDKVTSMDLDSMYEPLVTHYAYSDGSDNNSFFCFKEPTNRIYCMHDGYVNDVIDDLPDNNGLSGMNPLNVDKKNSVLVVQHRKGKARINRYSKYYHVRQNSAKVKINQMVNEGTYLADIGNAGKSSEPHLHVGYFKYNSAGRLQALPMTFNNLRFYYPPEPISIPVVGAALTKDVKSVPLNDIGLDAVLVLQAIIQ
jgi:hypothetical protein